MRLLDRNVDIVSALYCRRYPPFDPVCCKTFDPRTNKVEGYTWNELSEMPRNHLLEVAAVGAGALLVRRKVLEAMKAPWFRVGASHDPEWAMTPDYINEDNGFCWRARELGFKIHVDLGISFAHIPDEMLLVPIRQANGAFNIMGEIGEHRQWMFQEQKDVRRIIG
jgi:hypothetical protein